ncbi:MAG TPA: metallophosphoesterase family protein [Longimicrobium sp.]|nr:metallophosphoesterase family protein [Longimicrobium sp.]
MKIGIISDTHGLLRARVLELFDGVEHILHAGDVGDPDILTALEAVAPVTAVWGNVDGWDVRNRVSEVAEIERAGVKIVVVHGMQLGSPTPERVAAAYPHAGLAVFGHSHKPIIKQVGSTLAVNPGSAGHQRFRDPVSCAIAEIDGGRVTARLIDLDPARK